MKMRSRRMPWLALAAFVLPLVSSCKAAEMIGLSSPGYQLTIEQSVNLSDQLLGLYVIVADRGLVTESLKEEDYGAVLDERKIDEYTSYRHYTPVPGGGWRLETVGNTDRWVVFEETETAIELLVDKDLISKSSVRFCVAVIGQYEDEWTHKLIDDAPLNARETQRMEVSRASLNIITEE